MAEIRLEGIVKDYGAHRAIHGVDLHVNDGEFVAFVGPSGCGKSTMLRMIAGLEEISGGTLSIGGRKVNDVEPKGRDVAMVFQDYALYPHMTIRENIGFGLKMRGWKAADLAPKVEEAARILQIGDYLERKPGQLSGGQRQRVAMGRAIVREPSVFLFDEPLSNLDAKLRVEMRTQIKRLHAMLGTTTVYVTHDQTEAMTLADKIVVLRAGRVEQVGKPMELYNDPDNRFVAGFIGSPSMNFVEGEVRGGKVVVRAFGGREITTSVALPQDGAKVIVGLRPQHIRLSADGPATLDLRERLGGVSYDHLICAEGAKLIVETRDEDSLEEGDSVGFDFEDRDVFLFDAQSEERLR